MRIIGNLHELLAHTHCLCFVQALDPPRTTPALAVQPIQVEASLAEPAVALVVQEVRQDYFRSLETPRGSSTPL
jgi:hypothetical protein